MKQSLNRASVYKCGLTLALIGFSFVARASDEPMHSRQNWPISVRNATELRGALTRVRDVGGRIELASGDYGAFYFENLRGTSANPVVLRAADWQNPPRFVSMQLSKVAYLELHDMVFDGAPDNGLNIDDGGNFEKPSHHVLLSRLQVRNVGPQGNHDGIKLSGLEDFRVEECRVERWGLGGQGIDMVGCHRGVIEDNVVSHLEDAGDTDTYGVQPKGGSRDIFIRGNRFVNAGTRAINVGGSTSLDVFRPPLVTWPAAEGRWEAKNIVIEGNTFIGGGTPMAFVGVDGATARFNTIYRPQKWAIRILQETTAPGFVPCRNVRFSDNIVAFDSRNWIEGGVNIGPQTAPETFRFARNWWFAVDDPKRSRPKLPTPEANGVYGQDPQFQDAPQLNLSLKPDSPARRIGADAKN